MSSVCLPLASGQTQTDCAPNFDAPSQHSLAHFEQIGERSQSSIFQTSFSAASSLWDQLLTHQVALLAGAEMAFLATLSEWNKAKTVVDIGCGNGDYLSVLNRTFPLKRYYGIDTSHQLITVARRRHEGADVQFMVSSPAAYPDLGADVVMLRFVVQHLADAKAFFRELRTFCGPHTIVVVIEPSFADSRAIPPLPGFSAIVEKHERRCQSAANTRASIASSNGMRQLCGDGWDIAAEHRIVSEHTRGSWSNTPLAAVLDGWIALLELGGTPECDFAGAREEIKEWVSARGTSIEIALKSWVLRPHAESGLTE